MKITLKVCEIFRSIQGESTYAGLPCLFVRLTGCPLRCRYCDTRYAYYEGEDLPLEEVLQKVDSFGIELVEITGGEPLVQEGTIELCRELLRQGHRVLLETSGTLDISRVPERVVRIVDIKTPGSGEGEKMLWENIDRLRSTDEVKFVITSRDDFDWALRVVEQYQLLRRCSVLFSPAWSYQNPAELAGWVRDCGQPIRFQLPLHKVLWPDQERGV